MIPLSWYLILAAALFCIGMYGVLARRNAIAILMGIELMLNAVNINLVAFWRSPTTSAARSSPCSSSPWPPPRSASASPSSCSSTATVAASTSPKSI